MEQVKPRIVDMLQREKAISQADDLAKDILAKLNEGAKAEAIVKTNKTIRLHKPGLIARKPSKDSDNVSADIRQAAFRMAKPDSKVSIKQVPLINGDQAIVILTKVVDGKSVDKPEQQKLLTMYGNAGYDSYIEHLKSKADIKLYTENITGQ